MPDASLKWVIVPVETKVRELDAKLLLCCAAAEAGFGAIIGHQHAIRRIWRTLPRGAVLDKSVVKANREKFYAYRQSGNRVLAWCEEGLLLADTQDYLNRKIYPPTLATVDLFFAWGANQVDVVLGKVPEIEDKVRCVGNPRIDLLRPEFRGYFAQEVGELRRRYGSFILVNTNFAPYNNVRGMGTSLEIQKRSGKIVSAADEALFMRFVKFKKKMYHAFISMVERLAQAFPDHRLIIRPHPSENHENWRAAVQRWANADVVHEGNVINWLLAAELTIQNGCTTGIESFLLDRPTISYQPFDSGIYEDYLPDVLGTAVNSMDEMISLVEDVLAGNKLEEDGKLVQKRRLAARFIENVTGPLCIDVIVDLLKSLPLGREPLVPSMPARLFRIVENLPTQYRHTLRGIKDRFVSGESLTFNMGYQESLASVQKRVGRQIFPGFERDEITTKIHLLQQTTDRFHGLRVHPVSRNCVAIVPGAEVPGNEG
jgi:surface carbohydrate biosynthesis protein